MNRIKASVMALLIAITLFIYVHKPSDHEELSESPTTEVIPFDDALPAPEPIIVAEDIPQAKPETIEVESTFYVADCKGCSGITASGYDVRRTIYYGEYRVLAADKSIPFGTKMRVTLANGMEFNGIVLDRGSAITSGKLDVLVSSEKEAYSLGRQKALIEILSWGD